MTIIERLAALEAEVKQLRKAIEQPKRRAAVYRDEHGNEYRVATFYGTGGHVWEALEPIPDPKRFTTYKTSDGREIKMDYVEPDCMDGD